MTEKTFSQQQKEIHEQMIALTSRNKVICEMQGCYIEVGFDGRKIEHRIPNLMEAKN